jgi:hypothetical protein
MSSVLLSCGYFDESPWYCSCLSVFFELCWILLLICCAVILVNLHLKLINVSFFHYTIIYFVCLMPKFLNIRILIKLIRNIVFFNCLSVLCSSPHISTSSEKAVSNFHSSFAFSTNCSNSYCYWIQQKWRKDTAARNCIPTGPYLAFAVLYFLKCVLILFSKSYEH